MKPEVDSVRDKMCDIATARNRFVEINIFYFFSQYESKINFQSISK